MNGLDLFSGIGGITKALEGYVKPVAYCENDRHAQAVLFSLMANGKIPLAPIWNDIRTLQGYSLPPIDIIYGGFPCQDISVAGRGAGLEGKRSGLFFEITRLIGELRPRFVFLENVPAIRLRGGNIVVGELARLGYDCRWDVLSAADVGANHQRERWWLMAYAKSKQNVQREPRSMGETPEGREGSNPASWNGSKNMADADGRRFSECKSETESISRISRRSGWWLTEPNVGRVADGVPMRVDRLRALGNSVVPSQAREAFERLMGLSLSSEK